MPIQRKAIPPPKSNEKLLHTLVHPVRLELLSCFAVYIYKDPIPDVHSEVFIN